MKLTRLLSVFLTWTASAIAADSSAEEQLAQAKFFETEVRPLLIKHCYECHAEEKQKGGLRLDQIGHVLAGGESGPALEPHKPDESLLIEAVRYESYEMPPDGQLPQGKIDVLVKWVEMGAPWPGGDRTAPARTGESKITDEDRAYWAFQPLQLPGIPQLEQYGEWCRTEIDHFIVRKLNQEGITPSAEADRRTLVRRLYFDLIGLPPTPAQVEEFVTNPSPKAYEELVDELLASPRHGERWARFWLDLVRYAESDGFRKDDYRPTAWRYRDYVINSLNEDKSFALFIKEQIAGDEIDPHNPEALVATGFLRHGIYEYNQRDARTQWQDMLNDITDTVSDTFLGLGMGCARCHDHKFDPILQKDYFRLQAFFANVSFENKTAIATLAEIEAYEQKLREWEEATADIRTELDALEKPHLDKIAHDMIMMFPEDIQQIMDKPGHCARLARKTTGLPCAKADRRQTDHSLEQTQGRRKETVGHLEGQAQRV